MSAPALAMPSNGSLGEDYGVDGAEENEGYAYDLAARDPRACGGPSAAGAFSAYSQVVAAPGTSALVTAAPEAQRGVFEALCTAEDIADAINSERRVPLRTPIGFRGLGHLARQERHAPQRARHDVQGRACAVARHDASSGWEKGGGRRWHYVGPE